MLLFVCRSRVKTSVVESRRPLSVAPVASMHRIRVCKRKRGEAERLEGHTRATCRYPGPGSDGIGLMMDPPRPHAPSRMALYLAKAKGGAGQSVGETRR